MLECSETVTWERKCQTDLAFFFKYRKTVVIADKITQWGNPLNLLIYIYIYIYMCFHWCCKLINNLDLGEQQFVVQQLQWVIVNTGSGMTESKTPPWMNSSAVSTAGTLGKTDNVTFQDLCTALIVLQCSKTNSNCGCMYLLGLVSDLKAHMNVWCPWLTSVK